MGVSEPHVGANDAEENQDSKVPYFQRFQGLDLDARRARRATFWKLAERLRLAKETGVPGIVCDLEFYNNYKAYDLAELARMTSMPQQEVVNALRQLGARMAEIATAEYSARRSGSSSPASPVPSTGQPTANRTIWSRPTSLRACSTKFSCIVFRSEFCPAAKSVSAIAILPSTIFAKRSKSAPRISRRS